MSLYRKAVRDGVLVREKRKFLRFWLWSFNRSEEDYLTTMKNRLMALEQERHFLIKAIPEHQQRVTDERTRIMNAGGVSVPYRDKWTPRREPVRLKRDVKPPGKGKNKPKQTEQKPLFTINQANK